MPQDSPENPPPHPPRPSPKTQVYDCRLSYQENYRQGPARRDVCPDASLATRPLRFLGHLLDNPIGIAAGPLLNAQWVKFYLDCGFAAPVYKTVRSVAKPSYPPPNCVAIAMPAEKPQFDANDLESLELQARPAPMSLSSLRQLTITNSFGVPSADPKVWMPDVVVANSYCAPGQLLIVSVLGTEGAQGRSLAQDFAHTAALAKEAGAKLIEANLSCPNLAGSPSGMLYADVENAASIAKKIKDAIGNALPLLLKIGYLPAEKLEQLVAATRPYVAGYAGINTVPAKVFGPAGRQALPGAGRLRSGLGGAAIGQLAEQFVHHLAAIRKQRHDDFAIVATGGMMDAQDLQQRLNAGADLAMSATAAMWCPQLAQSWLALQANPLRDPA